jgi:hypothetical protein
MRSADAQRAASSKCLCGYGTGGAGGWWLVLLGVERKKYHFLPAAIYRPQAGAIADRSPESFPSLLYTGPSSAPFAPLGPIHVKQG